MIGQGVTWTSLLAAFLVGSGNRPPNPNKSFYWGMGDEIRNAE